MEADVADNRPEVIEEIFDEQRAHFPPYPLGTELTSHEESLAEALGWLQTETATLRGKLRRVLASTFKPVDIRHAGALDRVGLKQTVGIRQHIMKQLLGEALERTQR